MKVRAVWNFLKRRVTASGLKGFCRERKRPRYLETETARDRGTPVHGRTMFFRLRDGKRDHVAVFVVDGRRGVRERSRRQRTRVLFRSHGLQSWRIEAAEACAEWLPQGIMRGLGDSLTQLNDPGAAVTSRPIEGRG